MKSEIKGLAHKWKKKNHTRLTVKRSNKKVERKYLVEEIHVLYQCSSSESKRRIEEEEEMSSERKGKREKKEEGKNLDECKRNGRERRKFWN